MEKVLKTAEIIFWVAMFAIFLWMGASYIDIINNNLDGAQYAVWNFFNMI